MSCVINLEAALVKPALSTCNMYKYFFIRTRAKLLIVLDHFFCAISYSTEFKPTLPNLQLGKRGRHHIAAVRYNHQKQNGGKTIFLPFGGHAHFLKGLGLISPKSGVCIPPQVLCSICRYFEVSVVSQVSVRIEEAFLIHANTRKIPIKKIKYRPVSQVSVSQYLCPGIGQAIPVSQVSVSQYQSHRYRYRNTCETGITDRYL